MVQKGRRKIEWTINAVMTKKVFFFIGTIETNLLYIAKN